MVPAQTFNSWSVPDLKLTDYDLHCPRAYPADIVDDIQRHDHDIRRGKGSGDTTTLAYIKLHGWTEIKAHKTLTNGGSICGSTTVSSLVTIYNGWPSALCSITETLRISAEVTLSRQDLRLLHQVLLNFPRKVMAEHFHVSVKAIEKRMAKIKNMLQSHDCKCHSIQHCVHQLRLTDFLLAQADWFAPKTCFTVHK